MGLIGTPASHEAFETCDGFLIVGSSTPYYEFWPEPGQARGVQIDLNADRIGMRYPVEVGLVGHAQGVLERLLPLLERKTDRSFLDTAQETYRRWWELIGEQAASSGTPMRPQVVTWELSKALPDRAIVTGDAGTVTAWAAACGCARACTTPSPAPCAAWAPPCPTPSEPSAPTPTGRSSRSPVTAR
ncbi:hypothetical protein GCM10010216_62770 [Streptomyces flaveolus]|nr:hypothetical protein GCM10010216_62770 [Streptomyces flaveolus]